MVITKPIQSYQSRSAAQSINQSLKNHLQHSEQWCTVNITDKNLKLKEVEKTNYINKK